MGMIEARGNQASNRKPLCAAQKQALQVIVIKYSIDKTSDSPLHHVDSVMKRQKV